MAVSFLRRSIFLLVALFAVKSTPVSALQEFAREIHPLFTTGTSVWVLSALLAAILVSHPGLRQR